MDSQKKPNNEINEQLDLQEVDDIVIVNVDKGGEVVIMVVTDYIEKSERQLNNKDHYRQLSKDQTAANKETVNNVTERFQKENLITKNVAEGLRTTSPRTPRFYIQPKIHKQDNPGRPAISSRNCHTSNISKYVDYHLRPIVQQIPCYIQNTSDFLRKINKIEKIPDNSYLVSLDVRSLYTSILDSEGIKAVKNIFRELSKKKSS